MMATHIYSFQFKLPVTRQLIDNFYAKDVFQLHIDINQENKDASWEEYQNNFSLN